MKTYFEKKEILLLVALMTGIAGVIYWRVFSLYFIADDWWYLRQFQIMGNWEALLHFIDPNGKLVYRPLGEVFMVLMYEWFGFDPAPMRWPSLIVHVFSACMVVFIMAHVLENKLVGVLSGIVYASAIAIHLDIYAWAWATYYDIGAILFFVLSIWCYLNGRQAWSAVLYLVGCLFKPIIVFLPVLFVFHSLILPGENKVDLHPLRLLQKWYLFIMFGALIVGFKLMNGGSPTAMSEDAPYYMALWGKHLTANAVRYLTWLFQSIFPFYSPEIAFHKVIAGAAGLTFLGGTFTALLAVKRDPAFRRILFLLAWLVVGLLSVYFLPNQRYRYYAVYSLPAFAALFFYTLHLLLASLRVQPRVIQVVLSVLGVFALAGSAYQSTRVFEEKFNPNTFASGSNLLIRREATAKIVLETLKRDFPTLPSDTIVVLKNADVLSFGSGNSGLHYIYNDDTLNVYPPSAILYENGNWFLLTPDSDPLYIDPALAVVYELTDNGSLLSIELDDLAETPATP